MGVPRFKPPPRINYQTRSERISASSLSNARDRFCVVSLSPCDFFPEFLQVRYTGVNRERWWLRAMELFRSMGHSSMSIPRSRWNDRKFMEGERTRGWTKRETVYEFMTAARGLVRFISQYKFFFLSLSFYFFFFSLCTTGRRAPFLRCDHKAYRCLMPLRPVCNIRGPAARRRERGNTKRRQANEQRRGVTMASGRQVGSSLLLSSHPVARRFPIVPIEARAHISLRSSFYYHYCYYNFE